MTLFDCTPRIVCFASLLALAACELPTKLGELSATGTEATTGETSDSATSDATTESPGQTSGVTTAETTDKTTSEGTTIASTTVGPDETSGPETETEGPPQCEELDEAACNAGPCMAHYGVAYEFPGCSEGQVYLGCTDPQDCDEAETTVCKDGTDEVYKRPNSCHPAGFSACEAPTIAFCGQCEALDEAACLADPVECQPIYGAPHVDNQGVTCVDYEHPKFLRCVANGGACRPNVPTICPEGQPDEVYDSPSGCIPAGFEVCEGAGTPQCM